MKLLFAPNGIDGYEMAYRYRPDLILMDLRLPRQDGWTTARKLAEDGTTAGIPIIAISVMVEASDERQALAAGCAEYIAKPFDVRYLRERIIYHLEASSSPR